jgi:hypothetical protein
MHVSMQRGEWILVRVASPTDRHMNQQQGKPLMKPTRLRTTMLLALIPLLLASSQGRICGYSRRWRKPMYVRLTSDNRTGV